ncbi:DUF948 domain-containing protein [Butyrivibrio sp. AE2032]|uniref:DUF948 domain-containing protein n=1 Tax=Butyrivibrio sp. AE2032 TaxID=1458463 RepID=UPI000557FDA3|nr:DUF948 domain-containing protein [Butyrivibrio sp. AE2032]
MSDNQQNVASEQPTVTVTASGMDGQLLEEIKKLSKKQVRWQRLSALCILGALATVVIVLFMVIPRVLTTLDHINQVATKMESSIEDIDVMVDEMTDASKNLNKLVGENSTALTDAIEKMANVDYDGLNQAIQDLQDAIGPMATFFNRFK